ncbi:MAG: cupredoxin domain-containing protein, partial [Nocardioidaceae bacterium]
MRRPLLPALTVTALALPLAACTSNQPTGTSGGSDRAVTVTSTDDSCELSTDTAPSGTVVFDVTNRGEQVTEFYLLRKDGVAVAGEIENIGPGLHRQLVVEAQPGSYVTACKPGMKGKGLRATFTVTDSGKDVSDADRQLYDEASQTYRGYVQREVEQLVAGTRRFVTAYKAGDEDRARALYPRVRTHWERI